MSVQRGDAFELPDKKGHIFGVVLSVREEFQDCAFIADSGRYVGYLPITTVEYGKRRLAPLEVPLS